MRLLLLSVSLSLAACNQAATPGTTAPFDAGGPAGSPCLATTDCGGGLLCAFSVAQGCNAQGVCVVEDFSCSADGPVVCGCNGDPVGLACIYGAGNAPEPVTNSTPGCFSSFDSGFLE
jgi:hypothetical protein